MFKKMRMSKTICSECNLPMNNCKCVSGLGYKLLFGMIILVLGLFLIWPWKWFTFQHTLGLLVVLFGVKILCLEYYSNKCE